MMPATGETDGIEQLIAAAAGHGRQSEPEHQAGDLEQLLREAWRLMTPAQHRSLMRSAAAEDALAWLEEEIAR